MEAGAPEGRSSPPASKRRRLEMLEPKKAPEHHSGEAKEVPSTTRHGGRLERRLAADQHVEQLVAKLTREPKGGGVPKGLFQRPEPSPCMCTDNTRGTTVVSVLVCLQIGE
jgi:hypothetical protein